MTCSSPTRELLTFWLAGTLAPAEADAVARHVDMCPECRRDASVGKTLVDGLRELHLRPEEVVAAVASDDLPSHALVCCQCGDEIRLLRAVNADLANRERAKLRRRTWQAGVAAAATILLVAPVLYREFDRPAEPPAAMPARPASAPAGPQIVVEKPPVALAAADVLVMRGDTNARRAYLEGLAGALEPYRRNEFEAAISRLRPLATAYPGQPEVGYYLGVSLLLARRPAEAIAPLQEAAGRMSPPEPARFYLAVARVNAGDTRQGAADLRSLCDREWDGARRACSALASIAGEHR